MPMWCYHRHHFMVGVFFTLVRTFRATFFRFKLFSNSNGVCDVVSALMVFDSLLAAPPSWESIFFFCFLLLCPFEPSSKLLFVPWSADTGGEALRACETLLALSCSLLVCGLLFFWSRNQWSQTETVSQGHKCKALRTEMLARYCRSNWCTKLNV